MRFIHTADWHLGRLMHGRHLTEDQSHVLDQLTALARDFRPSALLISGDVYDRPVPPAEAVALLDEFLSRMVLDLNIQVLAIAGNHDSPSRLEFASKVLARRGLHLFGTVRPDAAPITLWDDFGPVAFYPLPFAEPAIVRETFADESIRDHQTALKEIIRRSGIAGPGVNRTVLLAHAFVVGGASTESERPLSVGGADSVESSNFTDFQYVALGHLHRPQMAGGPHLWYSGSLLKYSFSECADIKGVNLVEMDERGICTLERVPLTPRRDVRKVTGFLKEILNGPKSGENPDDYLMVSLLDTGALFDSIGKLREVYPNVLHVERPGLADGAAGCRNRSDHRKLNDADLFADFFSQVTGEDLGPEQAEAYEKAVDNLRGQEREAVVS